MIIQIIELHLRISIFLFPVSAQIYPVSYEVSSNVISESGSSETGNCSNVTDSGSVCNSPRSSVLFDGIPTLTELDGDMWARQLLTFNTSTSPANITFNFTTTSDSNGPTIYTGVQTIKVVMFNCPTRGIGTNSIIVSDKVTTIEAITLDTTLMNCSYFVRICVDLLTTSEILILTFQNICQRVFVAEVNLYSNPNRCSMAGPIISSISTTTTSAVNVSMASPVVVETASWSSSIVRETVFTSSSVSSINLKNEYDQRLFIIIAVSVLAAIIVLILLMISIVIIIYCNYKNKISKKVPQHEQVITEVCNETGQIVKINNSHSNDFELKSKNFNQDDFYSTVVDRTHISDKTAEPIKASHYETIEEELTLSESRCMTGVYAQIDKTKKKKSQFQPQPASPAIIIKWNTERVAMNNAQTKTSVDDLYSVVNKHMAPVIPMKSEDLLDELDKEIK